MRKVIIMSGVSGSGKSTHAKLLAQEGRLSSRSKIVTVSADDYFMVGGEYKFDPAKLSLAHGACFRKFMEVLNPMCDGGADLVIVDNTNTTAVEIAPYMLGAQAYEYEAEVITLTCPVGVLLNDYIDRCAARNSHGVSSAAVRAQIKRIFERNIPPWWKSSTVESKL